MDLVNVYGVYVGRLRNIFEGLATVFKMHSACVGTWPDTRTETRIVFLCAEYNFVA